MDCVPTYLATIFPSSWNVFYKTHYKYLDTIFINCRRRTMVLYNFCLFLFAVLMWSLHIFSMYSFPLSHEWVLWESCISSLKESILLFIFSCSINCYLGIFCWLSHISVHNKAWNIIRGGKNFDWCEMVLICIALMASDAEHLFICLWALCMSSLEKCLFKSFARNTNSKEPVRPHVRSSTIYNSQVLEAT